MFSEIMNQVSSWFESEVDKQEGINVTDETNSIKLMNIKKPTNLEGCSEYQLLQEDKKSAMVSPELHKYSQKQNFENYSSGITDKKECCNESTADRELEEKKETFEKMQNQISLDTQSFGDVVYSAIDKLGKIVSETTVMFIKTVEESGIIGDFNKAQEAFIKSQASDKSNVLLPWIGCANEDLLKDECLSLSNNRRNFICSPPIGAEFRFNYEVSYPIAMALMKDDPNLVKIRFELVPKIINEVNFWRNYFYRIHLICEANRSSSQEEEERNENISEIRVENEEMAIEYNKSSDVEICSLDEESKEILEN